MANAPRYLVVKGPVRDRLFADPRLQRAVGHVAGLGGRATGELIAELLEAAGGDPALLDRVLAWCSLDPRILRVLGGDRFPPTLQPVPDDLKNDGTES